MQLRHLGVIGLFGIACLMGCNVINSEYETRKNEISEIEGEGEEAESLGLVPEFDYEMPVSRPGILVNQTGYLPTGKKEAVFRGDKLPDRFEVVDENTGNVVFSGVVEEKDFDEKTGEYSGYGVFDALAQPGDYYIQAPILGHSYSFRIEKEIYTNAFELACRQYYFSRCGIELEKEWAGERARSACHTGTVVSKEEAGEQIEIKGGWHTDGDDSKDVVKGGSVMADLLLAYELYPEVFSDGSGIPESGNGIPDILDEIKYEMDWLLIMQDKRTGGVYSGIVNGKEGGNVQAPGIKSVMEPISLEATAFFAAIAAKFSYIYEVYDADYAKECLRAADKAWRYVEGERGIEDVEQRFFAAAELYRASGYSSYKRAAEGYFGKNIWEEMDDDYIFWGCTTYISTKRNVDITICGNVTKKLMEDAEKVSQAARGSGYLALGNGEPDNNGQLLHRMTRLVVVDHIIANHEYETLIENHLHYFMGCNAQAISYIDGEGDNNYKDIDTALGIMPRQEQNAKLIFMMSEVISWRRAVE